MHDCVLLVGFPSIATEELDCGWHKMWLEARDYDRVIDIRKHQKILGMTTLQTESTDKVSSWTSSQSMWQGCKELESALGIKPKKKAM
jgi:hypothetical protein